MSSIPCPGCGGRFSESDGPTHRYMESSPGCWSCFGEVLEREYGDPLFARVHRLTVDAYAIQHPGQPCDQSVRSVALHAISLCAIFEEGLELQQATQLMQRAARNKSRFEWLTPPGSRGALTVADVLQVRDATEHAKLVRNWAESAWLSWSEHHATIRAWLTASW